LNLNSIPARSDLPDAGREPLIRGSAAKIDKRLRRVPRAARPDEAAARGRLIRLSACTGLLSTAQSKLY
jgi:hypothetical protein